MNEVKERISSLQGRNGYTKETIAHMQNKMHDETIHYISFEDSNTKGLRGAMNGQTIRTKTHGVFMLITKGYIR